MTANDACADFEFHQVSAQMDFEDLQVFATQIDSLLVSRDRHPFVLDGSEHLFETEPREIIHRSLVVSAVSLLERELKVITEVARKHFRIGLKMSDLRGSLLERFRKYCLHGAGMESVADGSGWKDIEAIVEIRNCIVHADGWLDQFHNVRMVRKFSELHGTPDIQNGIILANTETSRKVLELIWRFVDDTFDRAKEWVRLKPD